MSSCWDSGVERLFFLDFRLDSRTPYDYLCGRTEKKGGLCTARGSGACTPGQGPAVGEYKSNTFRGDVPLKLILHETVERRGAKKRKILKVNEGEYQFEAQPPPPLAEGQEIPKRAPDSGLG